MVNRSTWRIVVALLCFTGLTLVSGLENVGEMSAALAADYDYLTLPAATILVPDIGERVSAAGLLTSLSFHTHTTQSPPPGFKLVTLRPAGQFGNHTLEARDLGLTLAGAAGNVTTLQLTRQLHTEPGDTLAFVLTGESLPVAFLNTSKPGLGGLTCAQPRTFQWSTSEGVGNEITLDEIMEDCLQFQYEAWFYGDDECETKTADGDEATEISQTLSGYHRCWFIETDGEDDVIELVFSSLDVANCPDNGVGLQIYNSTGLQDTLCDDILDAKSEVTIKCEQRNITVKLISNGNVNTEVTFTYKSVPADPKWYDGITDFIASIGDEIFAGIILGIICLIVILILAFGIKAGCDAIRKGRIGEDLDHVEQRKQSKNKVGVIEDETQPAKPGAKKGKKGCKKKRSLKKKKAAAAAAAVPVREVDAGERRSLPQSPALPRLPPLRAAPSPRRASSTLTALPMHASRVSSSAGHARDDASYQIDTDDEEEAASTQLSDSQIYGRRDLLDSRTSARVPPALTYDSPRRETGAPGAEGREGPGGEGEEGEGQEAEIGDGRPPKETDDVVLV